MAIRNIQIFFFGTDKKNTEIKIGIKTKIKVLFGIFRRFYEDFLISKYQKLLRMIIHNGFIMHMSQRHKKSPLKIKITA